MKNFFAKFSRLQKVLGAVLLAILILAIAAVLWLAFKPVSYGFDTIPATSKLPAFAQNADRVAGWTKNAANTVLADDSMVSYSNKAGTCSLTTRTVLYPAYLKGRGDLYNSKFALYDSATQWTQLIKNEGVTSIKSVQGSSLSFATGRYTYTDPASKKKVSAQVALRAIDKLYKRPATAIGTDQSDAYGLDESYGTPVLFASYNCAPGSGSTAEFQTLLKAISVNLK